MPAKFTAFLAQMHSFWLARALRERQLVLTAAGVVLLAVVYAGVYDPAAQGIAKLKLSLPKTQMQAAQTEQWAAQIAAQAQPQSSASSAADYASKAGIDASLQAAGLTAAQAAAAPAAPFTVTVQSASGEQIWAWLRAAPASAASFKRSPNGAWQGTATLAP